MLVRLNGVWAVDPALVSQVRRLASENGRELFDIWVVVGEETRGWKGLSDQESLALFERVVRSINGESPPPSGDKEPADESEDRLNVVSLRRTA